MKMERKRADCSVFFDDSMTVVSARQSGVSSWLAVQATNAENVLLGRRVLEAWELHNVGDPDKVTAQESDFACDLISRLFSVDNMHDIRRVDVVCARVSIDVIPSELKDENRYFVADQIIELPRDAGELAIGAAVREAMVLTLS